MLPILSHSARTAGLNNSSRAALSRVSGRGIIPPASALAARRGLQPHSSLASGQQQQQQQHSSNRTSALAAIAGCVLGSAALVSASAEEEKHEALFTPQQVQVCLFSRELSALGFLLLAESKTWCNRSSPLLAHLFVEKPVSGPPILRRFPAAV